MNVCIYEKRNFDVEMNLFPVLVFFEDSIKNIGSMDIEVY